MITAVDSSVLLDVLCEDPKHARASEAALRAAMTRGSLIVCECVVAEIGPALADAEVADFLRDWRLEFVPSSLESARVAGSHFRRYLERAPRATRVLPDFLIGAHAAQFADCLLARDRGYLRDYFGGLRVIIPGA